MASSSRFSVVEEEKITEIIDAAIPENTKRQTTWSVSIFNGELSKTKFFASFLGNSRSLLSPAGSHCKSIASSELKLNIKRVRDC